MRFNIINKILIWVWSDLIKPRVLIFFKIFILEMVGFGSQIFAYALLFKYVRSIEQNNNLEIYIFDLDSKSQSVLLIVSVGCGLLFLFSGALDYFSKIKTVNLGEAYEKFCSNRIIDMLRTSEKEQGLKLSLKRIRRAVVKDSRYCGRLSKVIVFSLSTLVKFFASLIFMYSVNLLLTFIILGLTIPLLIILKNMAKKVAKKTQAKELSLSEFILNKKKKIHNALLREEKDEKEKIDKDINSFYNLYHSIFKFMALNDLIIVGFIALFTVVIVLAAGNLVLFKNMSWTIFVAYIIALRYFFASLRGLNNMFKRSSRIYEYVNHYLITINLINLANQNSIEGFNYDLAEYNTTEDLSLFLENDDDEDEDEDED